MIWCEPGTFMMGSSVIEIGRELNDRGGKMWDETWGNSIVSSNANYNWDGFYSTGKDFKQTRNIGQYARNPWGFFDMHGNVVEFWNDWMGEYPTGAVTDPAGSSSPSRRVRRGGSWELYAHGVRSAKRSGD